MGVFKQKRESQPEELEYCEECQCCHRPDRSAATDLRGIQQTIEQTQDAMAEQKALEIWAFAIKAGIAVLSAYTIYQMANRYG